MFCCHRVYIFTQSSVKMLKSNSTLVKFVGLMKLDNFINFFQFILKTWIVYTCVKWSYYFTYHEDLVSLLEYNRIFINGNCIANTFNKQILNNITQYFVSIQPPCLGSILFYFYCMVRWRYCSMLRFGYWRSFFMNYLAFSIIF